MLAVAQGVALQTHDQVGEVPIVLQYGVDGAHWPPHDGGPWYAPHAAGVDTQPQ